MDAALVILEEFRRGDVPRAGADPRAPNQKQQQKLRKIVFAAMARPKSTLFTAGGACACLCGKLGRTLPSASFGEQASPTRGVAGRSVCCWAYGVCERLKLACGNCEQLRCSDAMRTRMGQCDFAVRASIASACGLLMNPRVAKRPMKHRKTLVRRRQIRRFSVSRCPLRNN